MYKKLTKSVCSIISRTRGESYSQTQRWINKNGVFFLHNDGGVALGSFINTWKARISYAYSHNWRCLYDDELRKRIRRGILRKRRVKKYGSGVLMTDSKRKKKKKGYICYRQGFRCTWCGNRIGPRVAQLDHIIRVQDGGSCHVDNLQALHDSCHKKKEILYEKLREQGKQDTITDFNKLPLIHNEDLAT